MKVIQRRQQLSYRHKVLNFFLLILLALGLTFTNSTTVHADANSLQDIATQFAKAGAKYSAGSSGKSKYVSTPAEGWNYLGPGGNSVLATGSKGTKTATYQALDSSGGQNEAFGTAGRFAYALRQAGLDHPTTGQMNIIIVIGRWIVAIVTVLILYFIFIVQGAIQIAYSLLVWINPFTAIGAFAKGSGSIAKTSIWYGLFQFVKPVYNFVQSLSLTSTIVALAATILFGLLGYSITTDEKGHHFTGHGMNSFSLGTFGGKIMKYFIRIMLIFGAPIIIAELASDLTSQMGDSLNVTNSIALHEIYGNFTEFDKWVEHSQLALPSPTKNNDDNNIKGGNHLDKYGSKPFTESYLLAINADGAGIKAAKNAQAQSLSNIGTADLNEKSNKGESIKAQLKKSANDVNDTAGMLMGKFANGTTVTANDWESNVFAALRAQANEKVKDGKKAKDGTDYGHSGKKQSWIDNAANGMHSWFDHNGIANPIGNFLTAGKLGGVKADTTKTPWAFVTYKNYDNLDDIHNNYFGKNGSLDYTKRKGYFTKDPASGGRGLSTVGMYNYLNTYADGTGLQYTQPKNFLGFGTTNQHASVGFIGHGLLSLGSVIRMWVLMATAALVVLIVFAIIAQGALHQIPNMLLYGIQLATGKWNAVKGVINALVGLYARIFIGVFVVYFFENSVYSINSWLDAKMTGTLSYAMIHISSMHGAGAMPLAISMNALGFARLIEAALTILLMYGIFKSMSDIIRWVNKAIDHALAFLSNASVKNGNRDLAKNLAANMPANDKNSKYRDKGSNNGGANGSNDPNSNYVDNGGDGDTPNTADAMKDKLNDPIASMNDKNLSMGDKLKQQAGMLGLDAMDKFDNSKLGGAIKKGAAAIGGAIGGSALGSTAFAAKVGMQGRGNGRQAFERAENRLRQSAGALVDPDKVNNSKRATLSKADKKALDAKEQNAKDMAADEANKKAAKKLQRADQNRDQEKQLLDNIKKLQHKDPAKAAKMLKENGYTNKDLKASDKAFNKMAKDHQQRQQHKIDKAQAKADKANKKYQDLKKLASAPKSSDPAMAKKQAQAKKQLPAARKAAAKAKQNVDKLKMASDPVMAARFASATGKLTGVNGENLKKASKEEIQEAKDRQFTAMTGQKLKGVDYDKLNSENPEERKEAQKQLQKAQEAVQATPDQIADAKKAIKESQATLSDPNATAEERAEAQQKLSDAQVVANTGYQYGQFQSLGTKDKYEQASQQQRDDAIQTQAADQLATSTGYEMKDDAPEASKVAQQDAKEVAQAQETLRTGQVSDGQGSKRLATATEMQRAQETLSATPEARQNMIQSRMMNTANAVEQAADDYVQKNAKIPEGATEQQANAIKSNARRAYFQQSSVQNTLKQAGIISDTNAQGKPTTAQEAMQSVQQMHDASALQRIGVDSSIAPLRKMAGRGHMDSQQRRQIIRTTAQESYGDLPATNGTVDADHYNVTTRRQARDAVQEMINAYNSGSQERIIQAKANADRVGLSNDLKNDPAKLTHFIKVYQSEEDSVVNRAISKAGNLDGPTPGTTDRDKEFHKQTQEEFEEFKKQRQRQRG